MVQKKSKRLTKAERVQKLADGEFLRQQQERQTFANGVRQGQEQAKVELAAQAKAKARDGKLIALQAFSQVVEAAARAVIAIMDDRGSL